MNVVGAWMTGLLILILAFLLLAPGSRTDEIIKSLSHFQTRSIMALQGRGT